MLELAQRDAICNLRVNAKRSTGHLPRSLSCRNLDGGINVTIYIRLQQRNKGEAQIRASRAAVSCLCFFTKRP
jgi:hypothetical protein